MGNLAIAGHRDGFFRTLKDAAVGDRIELRTPSGVRVYEIEDMAVIEPNDVSVLRDTPDRALTLLTCYPFYFVGDAPQRFVVRAIAVNPQTADS
jgi:sortase A